MKFVLGKEQEKFIPKMVEAMTYEEALNMCIFGQKIDGKNYYLICDEWFDAADRALAKQVPMKPIKYKANWLGDDKYTAYDCPRCKKCFTMKGFFDGRNAFCDICGQAIDWSE